MPTITTKDGVEIFYKDWGSGQPIVFSHGWPLSADDWDGQMLFFLNHGFRVIAHDRRGHGRSSQPGTGHDLDHYADDLAAVTAHLDLRNAVHIGHSTGGGEVVRYLPAMARAASRRRRSVGGAATHGARRRPIPAGCRRRCSTTCRRPLAANRAQFYLDIRRGRSTASTGRARRSPRV